MRVAYFSVSLYTMYVNDRKKNAEKNTLCLNILDRGRVMPGSNKNVQFKRQIEPNAFSDVMLLFLGRFLWLKIGCCALLVDPFTLFL